MKFRALLWIMLFWSVQLNAQRRSYIPSSRDTSVKLLSDDPISAALDSLAFLKLFDNVKYTGEFGRITIPGMNSD